MSWLSRKKTGPVHVTFVHDPACEQNPCLCDVLQIARQTRLMEAVREQSRIKREAAEAVLDRDCTCNFQPETGAAHSVACAEKYTNSRLRRTTDVDFDPTMYDLTPDEFLAKTAVLSRTGYVRLKELEAAVERVREIHKPRECDCAGHPKDEMWCKECIEDYPCRTIKALEGEQG